MCIYVNKNYRIFCQNNFFPQKIQKMVSEKQLFEVVHMYYKIILNCYVFKYRNI